MVGIGLLILQAEPKMEPKFIQATAVVGGQALEHLKEEHQVIIITNMLQKVITIIRVEIIMINTRCEGVKM